MTGWYLDTKGDRQSFSVRGENLTNIIEKLLWTTDFCKAEYEIESYIETETGKPAACWIKLTEENSVKKRVEEIVTALTVNKDIPGWRRGEDRPYFS